MQPLHCQAWANWANLLCWPGRQLICQWPWHEEQVTHLSESDAVHSSREQTMHVLCMILTGGTCPLLISGYSRFGRYQLGSWQAAFVPQVAVVCVTSNGTVIFGHDLLTVLASVCNFRDVNCNYNKTCIISLCL